MGELRDVVVGGGGRGEVLDVVVVGERRHLLVELRNFADTGGGGSRA